MVAKRKRTKQPRKPKRQHERNTSGLTPFKKGNPGKPKGAKNKFTRQIKEAIIEAIETSGHDGKGEGGAVGYFVWLSRAEPAVFSSVD